MIPNAAINTLQYSANANLTTSPTSKRKEIGPQRMDLSQLKSKCEFGPMPNVVIILETFQNAIVQDLNKKLDDMGETWKEAKDTMGNLKIATKEALRVRGETARRIEERDFWKNEFEKEKLEKEKVQKEIKELKMELCKVKEDKRIKNERILINNSNLLKKLHDEQHSKITLIDDILDQNSQLNSMKTSQRRQVLQEMQSASVLELEKMAMISERRSSPSMLAESKGFTSPHKASFV